MRHYPHPYKETPRRGSLKNALALVALGALLGSAWRACSRARQRELEAPARLPPRLQTWEGEGGRPDPDEGEVRAAGAPAPSGFQQTQVQAPRPPK